MGRAKVKNSLNIDIEDYDGGIISDALKILKADLPKKKAKEKMKDENTTAYLFTKEQVITVLSYFKRSEIKVYEEEGIFSLSKV